MGGGGGGGGGSSDRFLINADPSGCLKADKLDPLPITPSGRPYLMLPATGQGVTRDGHARQARGVRGRVCMARERESESRRQTRGGDVFQDESHYEVENVSVK